MRNLTILTILLFLMACEPPSPPPTTSLWNVKIEAEFASLTEAQSLVTLSVVDAIPELNLMTVASDANPFALVPGAVYAEPVVFVSIPPTQVGDMGLPWNLTKIRASDAWDLSRGAGVTVAVVDTGTWEDEYEFPGYSQVDCINFVIGESCETLHDHGTHVASIALGQNFGVAPSATLISIKALDTTGSGQDNWVAAGLVRAANLGAGVINLSLGSSFPSKPMCDAVSYAVSRGALVVAASGNNRGSEATWPAACPLAIAVGATNQADARAWFSNGFANQPQSVVAPGEAVAGWTPSGPQAWNGTSMASPHLAGLGALSKALDADLDQARFFEVLRATSIDLGQAGFDIGFGHGRIDALAALQYEPGAPMPTPMPTLPPTTPTPIPPKPTPTTPAYPSPQPTLPEKAWLELIARNFPEPAPLILVVLNAYRESEGLGRLRWDGRLATASAIVAGDGTKCPWDEVPIEHLLGQALAQVNYKDAKLWGLGLCGVYPDATSVLREIEQHGGPRVQELRDAGAVHLSSLDFERPSNSVVGTTKVTDIWVVLASTE